MISVEFLATCAVVVASPGPGVLFTISTGLAHGRRASVHAAVGCTLGIVPHMLASALGLAAVVHAGALAFQVLRFAGALYLAYLAIATWRDHGTPGPGDGVTRAGNGARLILQGALLNVLNPKLTLFFMAFLPPFIDPADADPMADFAVLSLVFACMTLVVFGTYGALAHRFRRRLSYAQGIRVGLRRGMALALALMAGRLAWSGR